ncbi:MAG: SRPBCC family protein [Streptosporangiaceae bacterium]
MDQVRITSTAAAQEVFDLIVDWPRQQEWMPFTRVSGEHGLGAAVEGWSGIGPVGFLDTMVITEWTPGRRVVTRHTGRVVRGDGWFETEPLPSGGCAVTWAEDLQAPLGTVGRFGLTLLGPANRVFMKIALRRLVRLAEDRTPPFPGG